MILNLKNIIYFKWRNYIVVIKGKNCVLVYFC